MAFKWDQPRGGQQPSLEESLAEIRDKFKGVKGFKGGPTINSFVIILVLGLAAWTSRSALPSLKSSIWGRLVSGSWSS